MARTPCPSQPTNTMCGSTVGLCACIIGRIVEPGGFGCARQFSTTLSDCAMVPTSMGVISCSTLTMRSAALGAGTERPFLGEHHPRRTLAVVALA